MQLLKRYEGEIDATRAKMDAERVNIRAEVERLEALNKELQELQVTQPFEPTFAARTDGRDA